jgi:hypothetical protein
MNSSSVKASIGEQARLTIDRAVGALLWFLTLLFAVRVIGQALQGWWPQSFLPRFDAFQGSGLPYPVLVTAQLIIFALMVRAALRVGAGTFDPSRGWLKFLTWFGVIYMAGCILRIVIGLTVSTAPRWFSTWIPAFFHLVLAAFVSTLALYARRRASGSPRTSGAGT